MGGPFPIGGSIVAPCLLRCFGVHALNRLLSYPSLSEGLFQGGNHRVRGGNHGHLAVLGWRTQLDRSEFANQVLDGALKRYVVQDRFPRDSGRLVPVVTLSHPPNQCPETPLRVPAAIAPLSSSSCVGPYSSLSTCRMVRTIRWGMWSPAWLRRCQFPGEQLLQVVETTSLPRQPSTVGRTREI